MIYDLFYSFLLFFMTAPLEMGSWTTLRIYLIIYLIDITYIDKVFDYVGQTFKFLCTLIGCEAQEGAEYTTCISYALNNLQGHIKHENLENSACDSLKYL